jgi:hypothetical protein
MHITVIPAGSGRFHARLGDRLLCTSRDPFPSAARVLAGEGVDGATVLTMSHDGSEVIALRWTVAKAAALTVVENERTGPRFAPYRPFREALRDAA